ncbi:hypothetical protein BC832DRAFT_546523 [Gaertneriomyces semiglobifer]|nr:hypothetical protein BC832DRAFT_546523 [Gaertneriomyces semiglobifer]
MDNRQYSQYPTQDDDVRFQIDSFLSLGSTASPRSLAAATPMSSMALYSSHQLSPQPHLNGNPSYQQYGEAPYLLSQTAQMFQQPSLPHQHPPAPTQSYGTHFETPTPRPGPFDMSLVSSHFSHRPGVESYSSTSYEASPFDSSQSDRLFSGALFETPPLNSGQQTESTFLLANLVAPTSSMSGATSQSVAPESMRNAGARQPASKGYGNGTYSASQFSNFPTSWDMESHGSTQPPRIDTQLLSNSYRRVSSASAHHLPLEPGSSSEGLDIPDDHSETSSHHHEEEQEDGSQSAKANLSRHVTSVISHFTGTKEGYRRLLNEIDDFVHVVSPAGTILFCSPSVRRFLGYSNDELAGQRLTDIIHRDDRTLAVQHFKNCLDDQKDFFVYIRYQKKAGDFTLVEVRGKAMSDEDGSRVKSIIQAAREYRSKASVSVDSLLEYRIQNLRLRRQLEAELRRRGVDPATHPLLKPISKEAPVFSPAELDADDSPVEPSRPPIATVNDTTVGNNGAPTLKRDSDQGADGATSGGRKKKAKVRQEELFCRQCGTTQSPEWRKGPFGPKTLCNACGLAYSKKQRRLNKAAEKAKEGTKPNGVSTDGQDNQAQPLATNPASAGVLPQSHGDIG